MTTSVRSTRAQDVAEHVAQRVGEPERRVGRGPGTPEVAECHAGTRRTRRYRPPETHDRGDETTAKSIGIATQSHEGDRIEKPWNTGWSTQGT